MSSGPELMAHGYTHRTLRTGTVITKEYQGPDAHARCAREATALTAVAGLLPVPRIIEAGPARLLTALMPGVHGQDLIGAGLAAPVLAACGRMLGRIHSLPLPAALAGAGGARSKVLVHGDFGPNNVLLDDRARAVTAVLDWEWAHSGAAIEDLAWCEFIVRLHHPAEVQALDGFYDGYGARPGWAEIQQAIVRRCEEMLEVCDGWRPGGTSARAWTERTSLARSWTQ